MSDEKLIENVVWYWERGDDPIARELPLDEAGKARLSSGLHMTGKLQRALEQVLRRSDFYQPEYFCEAALAEDAQALAARYDKLTALENLVLNRRLLEASFPDCIDKLAFTLEEATVQVRVKASKRPINLVLCNYSPVRWVIVAEEGAQIKNVIVGGHEVQDVFGTSAPIHYYVYRRLDPKERDTHEDTSFHASETLDRGHDQGYPRMVRMLRKLTGMEITSFQGEEQFERGVPFVGRSQL